MLSLSQSAHVFSNEGCTVLLAWMNRHGSSSPKEVQRNAMSLCPNTPKAWQFPWRESQERIGSTPWVRMNLGVHWTGTAFPVWIQG